MTREEAEFRLPDPGILLIFTREQVTIPSACKVCHICWILNWATYRNIGELKAELWREQDKIKFTARGRRVLQNSKELEIPVPLGVSTV